MLELLRSHHYSSLYQVGDAVIGTHFIDLAAISNDGEKGIIENFTHKLTA